ncbi:stage II sporulation protein R [Cohnella nanjingensis]|uniref:Stage II sporulation protein R n=1 Tax=Cohnella nanjingensis TaxID=1387779 RepID=A0A7X0RMB7_9BACL|nr:stage II sporulation protein R [Cohnella nanjingensis]MBB6669928.1 stage II sporulation protein R [Cohnella nanjingensis]
MRGLRHYGPFILLFLVGVVGFSTFAVRNAAADAEGDALIPNEAIRIRIIANSDGDRDQAVKRQVRDEVARLIDSWGAMPDTIEDARSLIKSHLDEVEKTANRVLKKEKAGYAAKTVLAKVDFPTKTFEGKEYPAGKYEALRVTLGDGKGANWWCVLFPPLCLTAATAADDRDAGPDQAKVEQASAKGDKQPKAQAVKSNAKTAQGGAEKQAAAQQQEKPHAKFFLWVLLEKLFAFLRALFS